MLVNSVICPGPISPSQTQRLGLGGLNQLIRFQTFEIRTDGGILNLRFIPIHSDSFRLVQTRSDSFRFVPIRSDSFRFGCVSLNE